MPILLEDSFPDLLKNVAYHPSAFIYAWKKRNLERLFKELNMSNIAVTGAEVWQVEEGVMNSLISMKNGEIRSYRFNLKIEEDEEWSDFVDRSTKEASEIINGWDLEREVLREKKEKICYHFFFAEE